VILRHARFSNSLDDFSGVGMERATIATPSVLRRDQAALALARGGAVADQVKHRALEFQFSVLDLKSKAAQFGPPRKLTSLVLGRKAIV
jgi:hypothetical protein